MIRFRQKTGGLFNSNDVGVCFWCFLMLLLMRYAITVAQIARMLFALVNTCKFMNELW